MEWCRDPVFACLFVLYGPIFPGPFTENLSFPLLLCNATTVIHQAHIYMWVNFLKFFLLLWKQPHQHPLRLACEAVPTGNEGLRSSSCSINHPIFQEGTKVRASPQSSSLFSLVLAHFLPSLHHGLPYPQPFFLPPSGHLHSHIWCLLQGHPGRQVAFEGQCKQVSPGHIWCVPRSPFSCPSQKLLSWIPSQPVTPLSLQWK